MVEQTTADGGRTDTTRFDESISADELIEGDRIDPDLIPRSPEIDVGASVARHIPRHNGAQNDDGRTYDVRLIAHGYRDQYQDVQVALVYDPEAELFVRLHGHTSSGAMNQLERDWKVGSVGSEIVVDDVWDVEIPDLEEFGETDEEFVTEWVSIVFDELRHGSDIEDLRKFDGKKFTLRDHDGRQARVQYHLED